MKVVEIRRYPVKSLLGERLREVDVVPRGLDGDRLWAVRGEDGKLGSGKNTRRFRRMDGLFDLRGYHADPVPLVELPDGRRFAADDPAGHRALSEALARTVTLAKEADVVHHDEGPVSLITTAALRQLADLAGGPIDALRFRANLLIDVPGAGFPEDGWIDRRLRVGAGVVLRPRRRLTRCRMIDIAQEGVPEARLLKVVAERHDLTFGVWATVERPGRVTVGDAVASGDGLDVTVPRSADARG